MNAPVTNALQPPSVLLMGASGNGKTYSISTLLEAGLEVFVVSTEPHGLDSLLDVVAARQLDLSKLHYTYVSPTRPGFGKLVDIAKIVSISDQSTLANMKVAPRQDSGFIRMLNSLVDFKDERDGKSYGSVTSFGSDKCLVIDSLSGVSAMAMDLVAGDKPTPNPGEWGTAMRQLDKFLLTCTSDLSCFFVMIAHIEQEEDPITGMKQVMVSTLGKKLAPSIPKFFSEVVVAETRTEPNNVKKYTWSTNTPNHVLKHRALPIGNNLEPSFKPIVEAHNKRLAMVTK